MVTTIVSSFVAFVSTNVDDIFILMALFSQIRAGVLGGDEAATLAKSGMQARHIILGQYLGFAALVALSIIGALSSFFIPVPWIGLLGLVPVYMGIKGLLALRKSDSDDEEESVSGAGTTLKVAAITVANGGDNIAIYIPIFASQTLSNNLITLIVFFALVAVWCYLGYKLVRTPVVASVLEKYGHVAVPFVLIALGVFILYHSGSFGLLPF
ncbi:cadmium resistance transporter [Paenibacillus sp. GCM10027629]|uniref:cadmium resistance transporter n=1 Tax=Paenibacillus sp. GCM10027629 TaxID=3273414 RepID=UPI0036250EC2